MDRIGNFLMLRFHITRRIILIVWFAFLLGQAQHFWLILQLGYNTLQNFGGMRNLEWHGMFAIIWVMFRQASFLAWIGIVSILLLAAESILVKPTEVDITPSPY